MKLRLFTYGLKSGTHFLEEKQRLSEKQNAALAVGTNRLTCVTKLGDRKCEIANKFFSDLNLSCDRVHSRARPIRAPVMPSVHFNESAIARADSDSLMKTPLNNALIPALNREHTLSNWRRENTT